MNIDEIKLLTGLRIKNIRERLKYTQEQMSELIQIDISALSKIENGKNFPSYETLYKFFGILKINPTELFDFDKKKFGKRLRQLRLSRNLSQDQLCDKLDMNASMLSNFETGKNAPALETMIKISKALDAEPNEMFDYSHFKTPKELETELLEIFNSLSTEKQMFYYRIIKLLQE